MAQTTYNIHAIHHTSLVVANCDRALTFYMDILGLEVDPDRPDLGYPGAWLTIGGNKKQQLHLMEFPEQAGLQKTGREAHPGHGPHLALAVENLSVIQAKLEQKKIKYSLSRSGRSALFCRDHDGNAIELIEI